MSKVQESVSAKVGTDVKAELQRLRIPIGYLVRAAVYRCLNDYRALAVSPIEESVSREIEMCTTPELIRREGEALETYFDAMNEAEDRRMDAQDSITKARLLRTEIERREHENDE